MRLKKIPTHLMTIDDKNSLFLHTKTAKKFQGPAMIGGFIFQIKQVMNDDLDVDEYFIDTHFEECLVSKNKLEDVQIKKVNVQIPPLNTVMLSIQTIETGFNEEQLEAAVKTTLNKKIINTGVSYLIEIGGGHVLAKIISVTVNGTIDGFHKFGIYEANTVTNIDNIDTFDLGQNNVDINMFYKLQQLGIGGLNKEFEVMFRRAFLSRIYPKNVINKFGIRNCKGIVLYGPPGTGKTLIARKISSLLTNVSPKVISGPELLNKYMGQSEENVRNVFADAKKDPDKLHVYIFDEIDSLCKVRGATGSNSTMDNITNQLLVEIDGVNEKQNILIFATTNRFDLLDPALLRSGRLEVHISVALPDFEGRKEIFMIHTAQMTKNKLLKMLDYDYLANSTPNYSGADIEAVVRDAVAYAMSEGIKLDDTGLNRSIERNIFVDMEHFVKALESRAISAKLLEEYGNLKVPKYINDESYLVEIIYDESTEQERNDIVEYIHKESSLVEKKEITPMEFIGLTSLEQCQRLRDYFNAIYYEKQCLLVIKDLDILLKNTELRSCFMTCYKYRKIPIVYTAKDPIPYTMDRYTYTI